MSSAETKASSYLRCIYIATMDLLSPYIKTPQLVGIVAGCMVFSITISVVFYLLVASGSLSKLAEELQADALPKSAQDKKKSTELHPQFGLIPELYDELIKARSTLPLCPTPPSSLEGKAVIVRKFDKSADDADVTQISDGRAIFHESSYNPARIWGWIDSDLLAADKKRKFGPAAPDAEALVVVDVELNKIIGMITLVDNCPANLSIRIGSIWITPAFQGKKRAHEALLLVLEWLNTAGYRRITAETDERNIFARKFLERCGFQHEATLRKHRIIQNRNSNTALYTVLNSDWVDVERKLKTLLGISLKATQHKIAEIEKPFEVEVLSSKGKAGADSKEEVKKKKKDKNKKKNH